MPLYEYECDACGQRFEVIQQRFSDPAPEKCLKCGKGPVHRQLSSPAIQFKGSGWYVTDYAQKGRSVPEKGEKGEKSDKGEKTEKSDKSDTTETKKTSDSASTPSTPTTSTKE
jgi:putative FmdB family regulatory protein